MYSYLPFASSILFLCQCARGFHWKPGSYSCPRCEPGEQCSYLYQVESGVEKTKVEGWCAPNYHCADNGAKCESDENCFGWCSDGICGGNGSICNTQAPFEHTDIHWEYSCFTPEFECTTEGTLGVCKRADVNRRRPFASDFRNSDADLNGNTTPR
ncbi:hypothetical protein BT69DRAFT_623473 [Atractiella rhizophila]|nr:hypothetical protein BT69DRAFT_623473 [Atractiella rhizophila]